MNLKLALCSIVLINLYTLCFSQTMEPIKPMIIAHRGASFVAPENTVASAKLGFSQGADAVEIDIYLSLDKRIMVMHDSDTKRTAGVNYILAKTLSDTLRKLNVGKWKNEKYTGEKIPFLEEILQTIPDGKKLIIEIKCGVEVIPYLKAILLKSGRIENYVIISFDFNVLAAAKVAMPNIPMYFLSSMVSVSSCKELILKIKEHKMEGLNLRYSTINTEIAELCKQNSVPLYTWTVDDIKDAANLVKLGVAGITTNKPLEIREGLGL